MTAVLPPRSTRVRNDLEVAFARCLTLDSYRRKVLVTAIRRGKVSFSTEAVDIGCPGLGPHSMDKLREDMLSDNVKRRTGADREFLAAQNHHAARQAEFRRWLRSGSVPRDWIDQLVAALRHDVTYLHFMVTPSDPIGVLLVELG